MIKPQLHILIGQLPISINYPNDGAAEKQWRLIVDMIANKEETVTIVHSGGTVFARLSAISAITWTKEQQHPMHGIVPAAPGLKLS